MKLEDLNQHPYALWYLGRLFDQQAQPLHLVEVTKTSIKIEMRVNLQRMQLDRLILKPINEKMIGYTAKADYENRTLEITLNANQAKQGKSTQDSGKVAA